jgi:hypothetical protein
MEKNNDCFCYAPTWCPDENQWEPGYECDNCRKVKDDKIIEPCEEQAHAWCISMNKGSYVNDDKDDDDLPF